MAKKKATKKISIYLKNTSKEYKSMLRRIECVEQSAESIQRSDILALKESLMKILSQVNANEESMSDTKEEIGFRIKTINKNISYLTDRYEDVERDLFAYKNKKVCEGVDLEERIKEIEKLCLIHKGKIDFIEKNISEQNTRINNIKSDASIQIAKTQGDFSRAINLLESRVRAYNNLSWIKRIFAKI